MRPMALPASVFDIYQQMSSALAFQGPVKKICPWFTIQMVTELQPALWKPLCSPLMSYLTQRGLGGRGGGRENHISPLMWYHNWSFNMRHYGEQRSHKVAFDTPTSYNGLGFLGVVRGWKPLYQMEQNEVFLPLVHCTKPQASSATSAPDWLTGGTHSNEASLVLRMSSSFLLS